MAQLGPTTDNVHAFLFHEAGDALVSFAFWRPEHPRPAELGRVFTIRIAEAVLLERLRRLGGILRRGV